jgi:hypothetical protein
MGTAVPTFTYLDFEILSEPWNKYKLSDGSILFNRVIVVQIVKTSSYDIYGKPQYGIITNTVNSLRATESLRGAPSVPQPSPLQLGNSIIQDVTAIPADEEKSNVYKCSDSSTFKIKNTFASIKRTSFYDMLGEPVYIIHTQNVVSDDIPRTLWKEK